jgi:hypothetical protein
MNTPTRNKTSTRRRFVKLAGRHPAIRHQHIGHCLGFHYCGVVIVGGCQSCAEAGFVASLATGESA